jgi:hypothetical protein
VKGEWRTSGGERRGRRRRRKGKGKNYSIGREALITTIHVR